MSHPNKSKGDRWEHELAGYLSNVKRCTRMGEHDDRGDLIETDTASPCWLIEAKDDQSHSFQRHISQAKAAKTRAGRAFYVVLHKARRRPTGEGYALMHIDEWERLRLYVRALEDALGQRDDLVAVLLP